MNEITLFIIVIIILILPQFLMRENKKPSVVYIRIISAIALLILVWVFGDEGKLSVKLILSALILTSLHKQFVSLKKPIVKNEK
jgi:cell division protein FtsB